MIVAFRDDLARAGTDSIESLNRFQFTIGPDELAEFKARIEDGGFQVLARGMGSVQVVG
jgi:hypothetical protein